LSSVSQHSVLSELTTHNHESIVYAQKYEEVLTLEHSELQ